MSTRAPRRLPRLPRARTATFWALGAVGGPEDVPRAPRPKLDACVALLRAFGVTSERRPGPHRRGSIGCGNGFVGGVPGSFGGAGAGCGFGDGGRGFTPNPSECVEVEPIPDAGLICDSRCKPVTA
jgi:hypothetical protein